MISLVCSPDGFIFAGRQGGFIYRSIQSTISVKSINSNVPKTFSLYQNYPNPFNPSTKIMFDLPSDKEQSFSDGLLVRLNIYDLRGRLVLVLLEEYIYPGSYGIELNDNKYNTTFISSGIYFYRLVYKSVSKTRPMVLIK